MCSNHVFLLGGLILSDEIIVQEYFPQLSRILLVVFLQRFRGVLVYCFFAYYRNIPRKNTVLFFISFFDILLLLHLLLLLRLPQLLLLLLLL